MDEFDKQLRNPENSKVVVDAPINPGSLAAIKSVEQVAAEIARGEEIRESASADPLAGKLLNNGGGSIKMTGVASANIYAVGDRIYHKKHKEEATVKEISSSGKLRVRWASGEKSWVRPENIVKL
jgi:hypothetical protein